MLQSSRSARVLPLPLGEGRGEGRVQVQLALTLALSHREREPVLRPANPVRSGYSGSSLEVGAFRSFWVFFAAPSLRRAAPRSAPRCSSPGRDPPCARNPPRWPLIQKGA